MFLNSFWLSRFRIRKYEARLISMSIMQIPCLNYWRPIYDLRAAYRTSIALPLVSVYTLCSALIFSYSFFRLCSSFLARLSSSLLTDSEDEKSLRDSFLLVLASPPAWEVKDFAFESLLHFGFLFVYFCFESELIEYRLLLRWGLASLFLALGELR